MKKVGLILLLLFATEPNGISTSEVDKDMLKDISRPISTSEIDSKKSEDISRPIRSAQDGGFSPFIPAGSSIRKPFKQTTPTTTTTKPSQRRATTAKPRAVQRPTTTTTFASNIKWNPSESGNIFWATNCDFQGKAAEKPRVTAKDCIKECEAEPECTHYTWAPPRGGMCWLKSGRVTRKDAIYRKAPGLQCGYVNVPETSETEVQSSERINWKGKNWSFGCDFYDSNVASSHTLSQDCEKTCEKTPECSHFTWVYEGEGGTCGLKSGEVTRDDAFPIDNRNIICGIIGSFKEDPANDPAWHIVIGGKNVDDLTSVEAFNWKTNEQCQLNDLPVGTRIHSATVLYQVPIICGGYSFEIPLESCYKYHEENDSWEPIANLMVATAAGAASVQVPDKGWFIFGGEGNSLTRSQKLNHPTGQWELGPDLFQSRTVTGECLVQLNDTHTAFLGGSNSYRGIVLFDWNTLTYSRQPEKLVGRRWKSACAILKNSNGDSLVAIAGGLHPDGKGLEIWSPLDGTVKLVSKLLPTETSKSLGLNHAQLVPINNGRELLLYGGYQGSFQNEIWKFSEKDSSWIKVGDLLLGREEHVVLPVASVKCKPQGNV